MCTAPSWEANHNSGVLPGWLSNCIQSTKYFNLTYFHLILKINVKVNNSLNSYLVEGNLKKH